LNNNKNIGIIFFLALVALLAVNGCNYSKNISGSLSSDTTLLWQNRILINGKLDKQIKDDVITQLNAAVLQKPNQAIFGLDVEAANIGYRMPRFKLLMYNILYKRIEKDSQTFYLEKKIAERPIIYDSIKKNSTKKIMKSILYNNGYFYAVIKDSIVTKKNKKTCVYYKINPNKFYVINDIKYTCNNPAIIAAIKLDEDKSLIKIGSHLSRATLAQESNRISLGLNNRGFFNMNPSAIEIITDTIDKDQLKLIDDPFAALFTDLDTTKNKFHNTTEVEIIIKDSLANKKIDTYIFGDIKVVYTDKIKAKDINFDLYGRDTINGITIIADSHPIDPKIIVNNIMFKSGDKFSLTPLENTINRLNRLTILRNNNIDVERINNGNKIDYIIYINMNNRYVKEAKLEGSQSDRYFLGNDIKLSITDNNAFKKAMRASVSINGGLQNVIKPKFAVQQYYAGANAEIRTPKAFLIEKYIKAEAQHKINTSLSLGYSYHQLASIFNQTDASINTSYFWSKNKRTNIRFAPVILSFLRTNYETPKIRDSFSKQEFFAQSLKDFAIFGSAISLEYNDKDDNKKKRFYYYRINIEKAGSIAKSLAPKYNIAEYLKIDNELKINQNYRKSSWVNRGFSSIGIPLNKSTIPFGKLQSSGGLNGMRAWDATELGPGRTNSILYKTVDERAKNRGDIKLEANSEFRYDIVTLFGGVAKLGGQVFAEAGNIWRFRDTTDNFAAQFKWEKFGQDIAACAGTGVRLDFSFFLIRVEYAARIKQPYIASNYGFTTWDDVKSREWRKTNARWQIGIGYPF
jgi:outer membrane protein insertion porin family